MIKKRVLELDILRGIAFLFVVLQHTIGGFSYRDDISEIDLLISKLLYVIAKCGVPVFIFLSALALLYRYKENLDIKDFYIKKFKYLFLPFAIWSLYRIKVTGTEIDGSIVWRILSGDAQYHLWYMSMIIRIYLYFPLIYYLNRFISKQRRSVKIASFLVLAILYVIIDDIDISNILIKIFFSNPTDLQIRFMNNSPLNHCFYFILGAYAAGNYEKYKEILICNKKKVLCAYSVLLGYEYYIALEGNLAYVFTWINKYLPVNTVFMSFSIVIFLLLSDFICKSITFISKILVFISRYSFPAYLIHVAVLNGLTFKMSITNELSHSVEFWLIGALKSIAICWVLSYMPFSKYVLGCSTRINMDKIKDIIMKNILLPGKRILFNHMRA